MAIPTLLHQLAQQIDGMKFQPISEHDLIEANQRQQFAEHNLRLEAIYLTDDEKQLIELLLDKGLPFDKHKPLLDAFLKGVLSDDNWQKYQHPSKQSINFQQWADYFEPDTQEQVLKNRYGITQSEPLEAIERLWVAIRHQSLPIIPFDSQGLKQLHQHLFSDIYQWAGQFR